MIKKTIYFGNPAYLSMKDRQLIAKFPVQSVETEKKDVQISIEDLGVVVLDSQQITLTNPLLIQLLENNTALITCNKSHLPTGLLLPLESNTLQSERFSKQIQLSKPIKKKIWQQTVVAKVNNQAMLLESLSKNALALRKMTKLVNSGDTKNIEGRAAAYYWKELFSDREGFTRDPDGIWPNGILNYGYAILRAMVARQLVATGLLPTLGVHHHNRYNAYCLADDIMEPFRPIVDYLCCGIVAEFGEESGFNTEIKKRLLEIGSFTIDIDGEKGPLMVQLQRTTSSLYKCFIGELKKVSYPNLEFQWT